MLNYSLCCVSGFSLGWLISLDCLDASTVGDSHCGWGYGNVHIARAIQLCMADAGRECYVSHQPIHSHPFLVPEWFPRSVESTPHSLGRKRCCYGSFTEMYVIPFTSVACQAKASNIKPDSRFDELMGILSGWTEEGLVQSPLNAPSLKPIM